MNFCDDTKHPSKNSVFLNNNNFEMDKNTPGCSSNNLDERSNEEFQNFNEIPGDIDDGDSDENQINLSDSYDDLPSNDESNDDVQLSSPSNSLNSDVDQRWYAIRGRWGINMMDNNHNAVMDRLVDNQLPEINQPQLQQQQQDEEETDFLEMDFEPDTNSEIENECLPNGHQQIQSNANPFNFHNHPALPLPQPEFRHTNNLPQPSSSRLIEPPIAVSLAADFSPAVTKNTGAKPKQLSAVSSNRNLKISKHVSDGDDVFKLTRATINNNIEPSSSPRLPSSIYSSATNSDEVYNLGASSSRAHTNLYNDPKLSINQNASSFMKIHKSPSKSSSHHNHKQQRLHEEQNDQFLFEIDPIKPRNSVTIYTTNCDEKVLIDALVSSTICRDMEHFYETFLFPGVAQSRAKLRNHFLLLQSLKAITVDCCWFSKPL
jgi:hypothetical protein